METTIEVDQRVMTVNYFGSVALTKGEEYVCLAQHLQGYYTPTCTLKLVFFFCVCSLKIVNTFLEK